MIKMFHRAVDLKYHEGTVLELTFQDGKVIRYDMAVLFDKYPQLCALKNRELFESGKLTGLGIIWNEDLDVETETIYEEGEVVQITKPVVSFVVGNAIAAARARKGLSQKELAESTGIDQSDLSKIERGLANPSIGTLSRIADAMDAELMVSIN